MPISKETIEAILALAKAFPDSPGDWIEPLEIAKKAIKDQGGGMTGITLEKFKKIVGAG